VKIAFAVFLFVHGFAHVVGFLTTTGIVKDEKTSGVPSLFFTGLKPGGAALWAFGIVWLLTAAGFVLCGVAVINEASWALPAIVAATAVSSILSIIWIKAAPMGIVANVAVVIALVVPAIYDRVLPG
jgi:hypothetical protein